MDLILPLVLVGSALHAWVLVGVGFRLPVLVPRWHLVVAGGWAFAGPPLLVVGGTPALVGAVLQFATATLLALDSRGLVGRYKRLQRDAFAEQDRRRRVAHANGTRTPEAGARRAEIGAAAREQVIVATASNPAVDEAVTEARKSREPARRRSEEGIAPRPLGSR